MDALMIILILGLLVLPLLGVVLALFAMRNLKDYKEEQNAWKLQVDMHLVELEVRLMQIDQKLYEQGAHNAAESATSKGFTTALESPLEATDTVPAQVILNPSSGSGSMRLPKNKEKDSASSSQNKDKETQNQPFVSQSALTTSAESSPEQTGPSLHQTEAFTHHEPARASETGESKPNSSAQPPPLPPTQEHIEPEWQKKMRIEAQAAKAKPNKSGLDWENWLGARGAAIGGGIVLALAAMFLFKHSASKGLLTPIIRLVMGFSFSGIALLLSAWLRTKKYKTTSNSLAGAALIGFFASTWAAYQLYSIMPLSIALILMILVTSTGALLSSRFSSQLIAHLAMLGGFATPILISSQQNDPLKLFSYLFLLNLGFLTLSRRQHWPILSLVALVITVAYQLAFTVFLPDSRSTLAMPLIIITFAFCFAIGKGRRSVETDLLWKWTRRLSFGMAFLVALPLAHSIDFPVHWIALSLMVAILSAGACWLSVDRRDEDLAKFAGLGAAIVLGIRMWHGFDISEWLLMGGFLLAALPFAVLPYWRGRGWRRQQDGGNEQVKPAITALACLFVVTASFPLFGDPILAWPWILLFLCFGAFGFHLSSFKGWERWALLSPAFAGAAIAFHYAVESQDPGYPRPFLFFAPVILGGIAFQLLALRAPSIRRIWAERGASAYALSFLLVLIFLQKNDDWHVWHFFLVTLALGALAAFAAIRESVGSMLFFAMLLTALTHVSFSHNAKSDFSQLILSLGGQLLGMIGFTLFPLLSHRRLAQQSWSWFSAILAVPIWFIGLIPLYQALFSKLPLALLPLALATFQLLVLRKILKHTEIPSTSKLIPQAWFSASASLLISIAIPLQLKHEWTNIGWAFLALALIHLWLKFRTAPLKYLAAILFTVVGFRLIFHLGFDHPGGGRIFNWLMYGYLMPLAAMIASIFILTKKTSAASDPAEMPAFLQQIRWFIAGLTGIAIFTSFVYLNLAVNHFYLGHYQLASFIQRLPARDLTLSIVWLIFSLGLMMIAIRGKVPILRRISLGFMVLSICKVFLYDLGELSDLYRAASLFGLAVSLILVSIIYRNLLGETPE